MEPLTGPLRKGPLRTLNLRKALIHDDSAISGIRHLVACQR